MKTLKVVVLAVAALGLVTSPVMAQETFVQKEGDTTFQRAPSNSTYVLAGASAGAGIGAALTIIGAGYGFSRIGGSALESMARQPEVAPRIQTAMLIIAALLEGATFFALIVCITVAGRTTGL